jgi:GR25 family glycosyltransferase involved in LPS biosynthesis
MKSYVITIEGNEVSEKGAALCISTSKKFKNDIKIEIFPAVTPKMAKTVMTGNGLNWKYPWEGKETDLATGLIKSAYPTKDKDARIACAMSHWLLWYKCMTEDVPLLIMEHDCMFTEKLDWKLILESKYDIIGINSPAAATRLAHKFHDIVQASPVWVMPVPTIDEFNIPQGLAGNSAYIIKPEGAKNLIEASREHGLWPNDALMCKQIIPNMGVTKTYFTRVQGLPSTTSQ